MKKLISILLIGICITSCQSNKNESNLTVFDLKYIQNLGILLIDEKVELFESNGGFKGIKQSGNFITSNRIASYWIDNHGKTINSAYFGNEIDSISFTDLISAPTYSSYLTVYKSNGEQFNVYVDADSSRTYKFLCKAQNNWIKYRTNK